MDNDPQQKMLTSMTKIPKDNMTQMQGIMILALKDNIRGSFISKQDRKPLHDLKVSIIQMEDCTDAVKLKYP